MSDLKLLKRFHALLVPHLGAFLASILFDVGMMLLALSVPLFTRVLFDYAYPYRDLALLNLAIASIVAVSFGSFFLSVCSDYLQIYINQEATAALQERVFHALQLLPLRFHQEKKLGDLLLRVTDDVAAAIGMVASLLPTILIDGGRFLIILGIALSINTKLTLLALLSVPLYALEARFYAGRRAQVREDAIDAESAMLSRASERLSNIVTIKAFGQERQETLSFAALIRRRYRVAVKQRFLDIIQTFTNSLTLQMWSVFLTWYLGYQVVLGRLTIGEIVALMLYLEQLEHPIRAFLQLFTDWKLGLVSMRRIEEVLSHPSEAEGNEARAHLAVREGEVAASHLTFGYAPDCAILHDVDVRFSPRTFTAIVGASGSGKTTLVNLLLRFFDPTSGILLIDGQNIAEVRICELRERVGIVAQEATLFDMTAIDNILYGNEGRSRGDAMQAASLAGAHDFIMRLPGGYDAPVGVEGSFLSGGQRQRIAIARTLLRNPAIVVFDEATSALDAESEYHIQETIVRLASTKTVIVVAHRLSTIKMADTILVLEDGRFVEQGAFEELFERRGAFYRYYWKQFGGLSTFRQQLGQELERAARYGSRFCLALLRVGAYEPLLAREGPIGAQRFMETVDLVLKKNMRMGDNCAVFEGKTILLLLPELDPDQLQGFFRRMQAILARGAGPDLVARIAREDLFFVGTSITRGSFKTPESLLWALAAAADAQAGRCGALFLPAEELAAYQ
jgi:ABC-type multidrug transport system fused ATPase/permease subunit/GGDEF domain-containing protein